jgi:hypothetical protein
MGMISLLLKGKNTYSALGMAPCGQVDTRPHEMEGRVARMGVVRSTFKIVAGQRKGKKPLERPGYRWMKMFKYLVSIVRACEIDATG